MTPVNSVNDANGIRQHTAAQPAPPADRPGTVRLEISVTLDFIALRLDAEHHRIDLLRIRTVSLMDTAAALDAIPAFSEGALRLRGARVPLVDLRAHPHASTGPNDQGAADIVVIETDESPVGVVIDARSDLEVIFPGLQSSALTRKLLGNHLLVRDADATPHLLVVMDVQPVNRPW